MKKVSVEKPKEAGSTAGDSELYLSSIREQISRSGLFYAGFAIGCFAMALFLSYGTVRHLESRYDTIKFFGQSNSPFIDYVLLFLVGVTIFWIALSLMFLWKSFNTRKAIATIILAEAICSSHKRNKQATTCNCLEYTRKYLDKLSGNGNGSSSKKTELADLVDLKEILNRESCAQQRTLLESKAQISALSTVQEAIDRL